MAEMLATHLDNLDVVDASENFIGEAEIPAFPNLGFFCCLFEELDTTTKCDYVFASFILEHVLDVQPVLGTVTRLLKPARRLFTVVPNARALSRQLAAHMG